MSFTKQQHECDHDSKVEPVEGCEWCEKEVYRRTHISHGDGTSGLPEPQKKNE